MYLWTSSFVALSPAGTGWEANWDAIVRGVRTFRRPTPKDNLVAWPEGPPMGLIGAWPTGRAPNYLDRTPVLLEALGEAIRAAVEDVERVRPGTRWGAVLGSSHGDPGPSALCTELGLSGVPPKDRHRIVASELGDFLCHGMGRVIPTWVVHGACASGLVALQVAEGILESGMVDAVVVACADSISRVAYAGFHRVGAMSSQGCAPFGAYRDGMTLSEAGAALIVARLPGPSVQIAIRSIAVNCDRSGTVEPSPDGIEAALVECLRVAEVPPTSVDFVYWHGTGTRLNDSAEHTAAARTFLDSIPPGTSTKGVLGHTMGASALLNVMAACETVRTGILPGCASIVKPASDEMNVAADTRRIDHARTGLCVALGFGGINSAALVCSTVEHL